MALAVPLLAGAAAGVAATSIAVGVAVGLGTMLVAGALAPEMPEIKQNDFGALINSSGANTAIPVVYGITKTGATRIYHEVVNDEYLLLVFSVSEGEIEGFDQIYLDGKKLLTNLSGTVQSGVIGQNQITSKFKKHVQVEVTNGTDDQAVLSMVKSATSGAQRPWTNDHRGRGRALIGLKILRDVNYGEVQGVPQVTALLKGKRVMDPRREGNPTLWIDNDDVPEHREVGRNPALCILDYLINPRYGAGIDISKIDVQSFLHGANWCDAVPFKCDGVVNQAQSYRKNLDDLLSSFNGHLLDDGGKLYLLVEDAQPVVRSFNGDNLIGAVNTSFGTSSSMFNTIEAKFKDPNSDYNDEVYIADDEALRVSDGKELKKSLTFNFTKDIDQVQKLASWALNKSRYPMVVQFTSDVDGLLSRPFDVVTYSDPELGIENKKFRILSVNRHLDGKSAGTAQISAIEYEETIYSTFYGNYAMPDNSGTSLAGPWDIEPPVNLAFEIKSFSDTGTGLLTWDKPLQYAFNVKSYVVQYKTSTSTKWQTLGESLDTQFHVKSLKNDTYEFRVGSRNTFGNVSDFNSISVQVLDNIVLPKVTNLAVQGTWDGPDLTIKWDDMDSLQVGVVDDSPLADGQELVGFYRGTYEVQIMDAQGTVRDTVQVKDNSFTYSFLKNKLDGLTRSLQFTVRIVSKSGNKHQQSDVLSTTNNQQGALSGLLIEAAANTLFVTFDPQQSSDFDGVLIYADNEFDFTPSAVNLVHDQQTGSQAQVIMASGSKYIKVAGYDVFGKDQLAYSNAVNIDFGMQFNDILGTESMLVPKVDVNGQITGLGAPADDGPFDPLVIVSSQFQIANGLTGVAPFEVHEGKVKIDTAVVNEIHASDIYAESLSSLSATMGEVQSANYSDGVSGFKLFTDGSAEFNDLHIRGTSTFEGQLNAATGTFSGLFESAVTDPVTNEPLFSMNGATGDVVATNVNVNGGTIKGAYIDGVTIEGSTIKGTQFFASDILTATDAGDPYYTDVPLSTLILNGSKTTIGVLGSSSTYRDSSIAPYYAYNGGPLGDYSRFKSKSQTITASLNIAGTSYVSTHDHWYEQQARVVLEDGTIVASTGTYNGGTMNFYHTYSNSMTKTGSGTGPLGPYSYVYIVTKALGVVDPNQPWNVVETPWVITCEFTFDYTGDLRFYHSFKFRHWYEESNPHKISNHQVNIEVNPV